MNKYPALGPRLPDPRPAATQGLGDSVLRALAVHGTPLTVPELTEQLDVHVNTVRTRLSALIEVGLVDRETAPAVGRGRPSHVYRASAAGLATLASDSAFEEYRGLTEAFAIHLSRQATDPAEEARAVGRVWGIQLAGRASSADSAAMTAGEVEGRAGQADVQVVELLDRLQFSPEQDVGGVALRTCPLLELATELPDVVCRVHLGLIEGAMERYGSADHQVELVPFAEPGACRLRLHLGTATEASPG